MINYRITSNLNKKFPFGTIPGSATVINGGGTAEGFIFDSEIASLIHQLWQDPVVIDSAS